MEIQIKMCRTTNGIIISIVHLTWKSCTLTFTLASQQQPLLADSSKKDFTSKSQYVKAERLP